MRKLIGGITAQNLAVSADGTYQSTVMLDTSNQTWNDSVTPDRSTTSGTSENDDNVNLASTSLYYARSYPPPYIRVRVYNIGPSSCFVPTTDPYVRRWFRTRFYVLHTAAREINGANWPDDRPVSRGGTGGTSPFRQFAFQAVAQWILNYAWYHSLITSTSVAAVDNTTNSQCFDPGATIPRQYGNIAVDWNAWASAAMQYRMVQFGDVGKLTETGFLGAGTELCGTASSCYGAVSCTPDLGVFADSAFDPHLPHTGSQLGAKRANDYCFVDWKDIAQHYFQYNNGLPERTGELAPSLQPPAPQPGYLHVDNTSSSGQLSFTFSVRFKNVPVGWKYQIVRSTAPNTSGTAICCNVPPSPKAGGAVEPVDQTFTYQPPADTRQSNARCYYYRVRAWNPDGWGYFTNFVASANVVAGTSGKEICPAV